MHWTGIDWVSLWGTIDWSTRHRGVAPHKHMVVDRCSRSSINKIGFDWFNHTCYFYVCSVALDQPTWAMKWLNVQHAAVPWSFICKGVLNIHLISLTYIFLYFYWYKHKNFRKSRTKKIIIDNSWYIRVMAKHLLIDTLSKRPVLKRPLRAEWFKFIVVICDASFLYTVWNMTNAKVDWSRLWSLLNGYLSSCLCNLNRGFAYILVAIYIIF